MICHGIQVAPRKQPIVKRWAAMMVTFAGLMTLAVCGASDNGSAGGNGNVEWPTNGGDVEGSYWSSLDQVAERNVAELGPAWVFDLDTTRGQESEPIVVGGVMYVSSAWSKVFALDAKTGKQIWAFDPEVPGADGANVCCDVVNRGVAVSDGRVFIGTLDARLVALDAKTGKQIWSVETGEQDREYSITGVPRIVRDKVIIGNGGADFDARGYVTAYNVKTGAKLWRFYTVPGDPAKPDNAASDDVIERLARPTWFGDKYWKYGGGGTAWNAISYDPELDQLYIGTGNGTPWNHKFRSEGRGDNLFLCSIIALDPDTGEYIWHYQQNPGESWDYNSTQPMVLTQLTIGGQDRKVILHAPKNGFFYVIDRTDGKLISAEPFVEGVNWARSINLKTGRPVENPDARYVTAPFLLSPGAGGAHNWYPMAFSSETQRIYLPAAESAMLYRSADDFKRGGDGVAAEGLDFTPRPGDPPPTLQDKHLLIAWDPIAAKPVWSIPGGVSGILATAGGLLFQGRGDLTGELLAHRASDGKILWRQHLPNGIMAVPITYMIDGEQYIAVVTGSGGRALLAAPQAYASQVGRVVAFKLGGKAQLPPDPGPPPPLNPSGKEWPAAVVAAGAASYVKYCFRCHGLPAAASNVIPDLRRSGTLQDPAVWKAIVIDGVLEQNGMIGWRKHLSAQDAENIRAFIDREAQVAAKGEAGASISGSVQ